MMRRLLYVSILLTLFSGGPSARGDDLDRVKVLMTVGGVAYHTSVVRHLRADPTLDLTVLDFDDRPDLLVSDELTKADALLMYHRDNMADSEERGALQSFLARGGGVVVLHHAIANYPDWPEWWQDHVGGLYRLSDSGEGPASTYFYGFSGVARPVIPHPVTRRLGPSWRYEDESYSGLWVSPAVRMLLTTTAFGSDGNLAWVGPSDTSRVTYIQPGHSETVMADPRYQHLLVDAIHWVAGRTN